MKKKMKYEGRSFVSPGARNFIRAFWCLTSLTKNLKKGVYARVGQEGGRERELEGAGKTDLETHANLFHFTAAYPSIDYE